MRNSLNKIVFGVALMYLPACTPQINNLNEQYTRINTYDRPQIERQVEGLNELRINKGYIENLDGQSAQIKHYDTPSIERIIEGLNGLRIND